MEGEINKKFFGTPVDRTFENVLITNIGPLYDAILKKSEIICLNNGFYYSPLIKLKGNSWRIIRITPGNVIIDVLKLIRPQVNRIVLVGITGCLNNSFKVGEVIVPVESVNADDLKKSIKFTSSGVVRGKICQTDGLIQNQDFYLKLVASGVDFVDMESYYLAKFASDNGKFSKFVGVVSDNPMVDPFHKTQYKSQKINVDMIIDNI